MKRLNNKKGFTLVEIVIVLAIAALVLAGIFLAVQGAQRSQRDTERRDGAARLVAASQEVAGNNGGVNPASCAAIGAAWNGGAYTCNGGAISQTNFTYTPNADCAGVAGRFVAVRINLEGGAGYCLDNN